MIRPQDLLCPKPEGLYCAPGDFYIDPTRPVARAWSAWPWVITARATGRTGSM